MTRRYSDRPAYPRPYPWTPPPGDALPGHRECGRLAFCHFARLRAAFNTATGFRNPFFGTLPPAFGPEHHPPERLIPGGSGRVLFSESYMLVATV